MTFKQDLEKLQDRLAKILALADPSRNPSPEEAQAAMDKALALAREHNIELSTIKAKEYHGNAAIQTSVSCDLTHLPTEVVNVVACILQECLQVHILLSCDYDEKRRPLVKGFNLFGAPEDVLLAKGLWDYILQSLVDGWGRFLDTREICYGDADLMNRRSVHISFCEAFAQGAITRNKVEEPKAAEYGLVIRNKAEAADELMRRLFPNTISMRSTRYRNNEDAAAAGHEAGSHISLAPQIHNTL